MIIASDFPCHVGALGIFTRVTIPFTFPVRTLSSVKPEAQSYRLSVARGPASWGSPHPSAFSSQLNRASDTRGHCGEMGCGFQAGLHGTLQRRRALSLKHCLLAV